MEPVTGHAPKQPTPAEPQGPVSCAFCDSPDTERIGQWGGQIITSQWRCRGCGSYFEALREDYAAARDTASSDEK
jgi:transposase-like protein